MRLEKGAAGEVAALVVSVDDIGAGVGDFHRCALHHGLGVADTAGDDGVLRGCREQGEEKKTQASLNMEPPTSSVVTLM